MLNLRAIAIHLPQFHPIPENDEWWGKGFTEWTNVAKARPLFEGHYQPHLPSDLGFYDLRLEEARVAQEKLAREYGIYGFCYYHYWFNGKRMLYEPIERKMRNPKEDMPFMFCWANENWTRVWDGGSNEILLKQEYSPEDDLRHIQVLIPYFLDSRYIRIENRPVIAIYRSNLLPDISKTLSIWRAEAQRHGIKLYVCEFETLGCEIGSSQTKGFDASIEFQPHGGINRLLAENGKIETLRDRVSLQTIKRSIQFRIRKFFNRKDKDSKNIILPYADFMNLALQDNLAGRKVYPCVTPGWDNTARKKSGYLLLKDSTPDLFGEWLRKRKDNFKPLGNDENLFFINAWNEWAEGNHLEPCLKWGRAYLEEVKKLTN